MTIISKSYAKKLISKKQAREEGIMYDSFTDKSYVIVTDLHRQRTIHYFLDWGDRRYDIKTITKKYARQLINKKQGEEEEIIYNPFYEESYMVINDLHQQRKLKYWIGFGDRRDVLHTI